MIELHDWAATVELAEKPWLILGKGPTAQRLAEFDVDDHNVVTLNHAILESDALIAHILDVDVLEDCEHALGERAKWVVMPRVPHVRQRPGQAELERYVAASPVLRRLDAEGRLIWYNAETGPRLDGAPVVEVRYFSSEAALSILGALGAREVRTLGVDGGSGYAPAFATRFAHTRLANGQPSFDQQFAELRRIARRFSIDLRPLVPPVRVFVGAGADEMVPYRVLAHSIHQQSSVPVVVERLPVYAGPMPRSRANRPRTAFSFSRFLIPELCDYQGDAVYLDSDMLVFADVAELLAEGSKESAVRCTRQEAPRLWDRNDWFKPGRQFSVMVLDCTRLDWRIEEIVGRLNDGSLTYESLLFDMALLDESEIDDTVDPRWNSLEDHDQQTALTHFTVVPTQPWRSTTNPLRDLWLSAFRRAVADGAVPRSEVEDLVSGGGASDLLAIFDEARGESVPPGDTPLLAVALDAAFERIDGLYSRSLRSRVRRRLTWLSPQVRRARARFGPSPLGRAVESVAEVARRALR